MNQSQKGILRMVAILDILLAIVLLGLTLAKVIDIPILVPLGIGVSGFGIFAITFFAK